ncbi:MAG: hypothetical protein RP166_0390 [Rapeseed phyllody phytoplasma]|uniref:Uncharacterized protein n=1 Tax=Rapeseed phyllody phytoplasma TaxID=2490543 RepID=A0A859IAT7_9MOLU|nr:MAG: hypothetical protein RP166_0390 [Rapeseed phyllody phytoplasma]
MNNNQNPINTNPMNNSPVTVKRHFITRFWIAFVCSLISKINLLAGVAYFIITIYNQYLILAKIGKMAHQAENQNHKSFLNRWLISFLLMFGGALALIYNFTQQILQMQENFNHLQISGTIILFALLSLLSGSILYFVNEAMLYKFLDRFEQRRNINLNNFYSRFIKSIIFKLFAITLILFNLKNFDLNNIYAIFSNSNAMLIISIGIICFFISYILYLINYYKVCSLMDVLGD